MSGGGTGPLKPRQPFSGNGANSSGFDPKDDAKIPFIFHEGFFIIRSHND
jgi:hypothetical protein